MEIMVERFRKKINQLPIVPRLGKFNIHTLLKDLDLPKITIKTRETTPSFWQFLNILATTHYYHGQNHQITKTFDGECYTLGSLVAKR
jgi:hypothetical protein